MIPNSFINIHLCFLSGFLFLTGTIGFAADDIRTQRVHFNRGVHVAVVESSIRGYETVDYVLGAHAGQHINVSLATKHDATYFNILAPGESEVASFNGSVSQNQYEGTLVKSGDYKVRVYMMRSAARRNEVSKYRLEIIVDGTERSTAQTPSHDAKVPGTDYHATGNITCVMAKGKPTGICAFGVIREGNGSATITITKEDGGPRVIYFENGRATGYDKSPAVSGEFKVKKEEDLNIITIGEERYEVPDAIPIGG